MEKIVVRARNNTEIPVRLTITNSGNQILVTIGGAGVALSDFYRVCIDRDLPPHEVWQEIGSLNINTIATTEIQGLAQIK